MDSHRLRVKIGEHEFEAEGSAESVTAQFEAWKELIALASHPLKKPNDGFLKLSRAAEEAKTTDGFRAATWDIYDCDEKKRLVSLKVHPTGESRDADALLLILWGYKMSFSLDEVPVTLLKTSMERSGIHTGRIDRSIAPLQSQGLVLKGGHGKGGKYRLTTIGLSRAEEMARILFEKLV